MQYPFWALPSEYELPSVAFAAEINNRDWKGCRESHSGEGPGEPFRSLRTLGAHPCRLGIGVLSKGASTTPLS